MDKCDHTFFITKWLESRRLPERTVLNTRGAKGDYVWYPLNPRRSRRMLRMLNEKSRRLKFESKWWWWMLLLLPAVHVIVSTFSDCTIVLKVETSGKWSEYLEISISVAAAGCLVRLLAMKLLSGARSTMRHERKGNSCNLGILTWY